MQMFPEPGWIHRPYFMWSRGEDKLTVEGVCGLWVMLPDLNKRMNE